MKIFEIRSQGEKTWVAAETNIGALRHLCQAEDTTLGDFSDTAEVAELPDAEWDTHTINDEDGTPMSTFRSWMKTVSHPEIITSTAY